MANENLFLLYALRMGIFITFVYDLLRIWRRVLIHNRFWVSVEDLGFWCFCAVEVFLLMYRESNGTLRWFAILGALVGMFLYKKTISSFLVKYASMGLRKLLGLAGKILKLLLKPAAVAGRTAGRVTGSFSGKGKKAGRKLKNKLTGFWKMLKIVGKK